MPNRRGTRSSIQRPCSPSSRAPLGLTGVSLAYAKAGRRAEASAAALDLLGRLPPGAAQRAEVERLRNANGLPILVSMGDAAASGGYWIAADADRILANPLTLTGSTLSRLRSAITASISGCSTTPQA